MNHRSGIETLWVCDSPKCNRRKKESGVRLPARWSTINTRLRYSDSKMATLELATFMEVGHICDKCTNKIIAAVVGESEAGPWPEP